MSLAVLRSVDFRVVVARKGTNSEKAPERFRSGAFQYLVGPGRFELPTSAMSKTRTNIGNSMK